MQHKNVNCYIVFILVHILLCWQQMVSTKLSLFAVVNWKNAPAYKLARSLVKKLQTHVPLLYTFNIKNSIQLINDLKDIPFNQNLRLASFDISYMYTNIPTDKLLTIIESACKNNDVEEALKHDILKLLRVVID